MKYKLRMVALSTAVAYIVTTLPGCNNPQTRYSEDDVAVAVIGTTEPLKVAPERIAVLGRIQIVDKGGQLIDPSSDLVIYILHDIYPLNGSLPDWSVGQLAQLQSKPFTTDKDGYFRITLPRGRYYPQFIFRKKSLGVFSVNPNVRFDLSDARAIAYSGTLTLTIDGQRLDELKKEGAFKDIIVEGAANLVVSNDFTKDSQRFLVELGTQATDPVSHHLLMVAPGSVPNMLTSEIILTEKQKGVYAAKILMLATALIILLPLMILSGGTIQFDR